MWIQQCNLFFHVIAVFPEPWPRRRRPGVRDWEGGHRWIPAAAGGRGGGGGRWVEIPWTERLAHLSERKCFFFGKSTVGQTWKKWETTIIRNIICRIRMCKKISCLYIQAVHAFFWQRQKTTEDFYLASEPLHGAKWRKISGTQQSTDIDIVSLCFLGRVSKEQPLTHHVQFDFFYSGEFFSGFNSSWKCQFCKTWML